MPTFHKAAKRSTRSCTQKSETESAPAGKHSDRSQHTIAPAAGRSPWWRHRRPVAPAAAAAAVVAAAGSRWQRLAVAGLVAGRPAAAAVVVAAAGRSDRPLGWLLRRRCIGRIVAGRCRTIVAGSRFGQLRAQRRFNNAELTLFVQTESEKRGVNKQALGYKTISRLHAFW